MAFDPSTARPIGAYQGATPQLSDQMDATDAAGGVVDVQVGPDGKVIPKKIKFDPSTAKVFNPATAKPVAKEESGFDLPRAIALAGRAAGEGALSLPAMFLDAMRGGPLQRALFKNAPKSPQDEAKGFFDRNSYTPETTGERIGSDVVQGAVGGAMGAPARAILPFMAAGGAGGFASGATRESGGGGLAQFGAGVAGNLGAAGAIRLGSKIGDAFTNVADRALREGGAVRGAATVANLAAGKDKAAIIDQLRNGTGSIPGMPLDAGQLAAKTGNAEFTALIDLVKRQAGSPMYKLDKAQTDALKAYVNTLSRSDNPNARQEVISKLNKRLGPDLQQAYDQANLYANKVPSLAAALEATQKSRIDALRQQGTAQTDAANYLTRGENAWMASPNGPSPNALPNFPRVNNPNGPLDASVGYQYGFPSGPLRSEIPTNQPTLEKILMAKGGGTGQQIPMNQPAPGVQARVPQPNEPYAGMPRQYQQAPTPEAYGPQSNIKVGEPLTPFAARAKEAENAAYDFAAVAKTRQMEGRALSGQLDEIKGLGYNPLSGENLAARAESYLKKPGDMASDVVIETMGPLAEKFRKFSDANGIIDSRNVHTIRKEIADSIGAKALANGWDKRRTASVELAVKNAIDDAMTQAGAKGWKDWLNNYREGMKSANDITVGGDIEKVLFSGKGEVREVALLNALKNATLSPKLLTRAGMARTSNIDDLMTGSGKATKNNIVDFAKAETEVEKMVKFGTPKAQEAIGLAFDPIKQVNAMYRPLMILNMVTRQLEGKGGKQSMAALTDMALNNPKALAAAMEKLTPAQRASFFDVARQAGASQAGLLGM